MNEEPKNFARISLKKSSSTGKIGYDIVVQASDEMLSELGQKNMDKVAEIALKSALKVQTQLP